MTSAASAITAGVFQHVAYVKAGSSGKLFVGGAQVGSTYTDSNTYVQGPVTVGAAQNLSGQFAGLLKHLRITKGVGRYTGSFTVPSTPFPTR